MESGINLTYFNLVAETMNIGCCFAGYATAAAKRSREVRELLGIKEDEECFSAMCFGYKTIRAQRILSDLILHSFIFSEIQFLTPSEISCV